MKRRFDRDLQKYIFIALINIVKEIIKISFDE